MMTKGLFEAMGASGAQARPDARFFCMRLQSGGKK